MELEDSQEIFGVNTIKQKLEAEVILSQKKIEFYLEKGLQIKDPNNFNLRGDINFKANVTIDTGCVFDGEINLGKNVEIGPIQFLKTSISRIMFESMHLVLSKKVKSKRIALLVLSPD